MILGFDTIARILLFVIPLYIANSSAVVFHGKTPIDFHKKLMDGYPILGEGKTVKGAFFGILFGTLSAVLLYYLLPQTTLLLTNNYLYAGFVLAFGAILGDMCGAFIKRRFGLERGKPVLFLDQLDFVAGGIILTMPFIQLSFIEILIIVIATPLIHKLANMFAYNAKLKKHPW
ncbi:MAG: CDP-2,3-bis-(O-geranylgeranyl)-sn-glycerol synthase [archaeon]